MNVDIHRKKNYPNEDSIFRSIDEISLNSHQKIKLDYNVEIQQKSTTKLET